MKKILAFVITLLLAFSLFVPANAEQLVNGTPINWSNSNAQVKFTPSKRSDQMEPDSTLITFIDSSNPTSKTYRIEIRKTNQGNVPVLCTNSDSETEPNTSTSFYLSPNYTYSIKIEENTLNIIKPDDTNVAKFKLIDGFENTDTFVYGDCRVMPAGKIVLIANDNISDQQNVLSENVTDSDNLSEEQPGELASDPVNGNLSGTFDNNESEDKEPSSFWGTVGWIFLVVLIVVVVGLIVIFILRYVNGKAKKEKLNNNKPKENNTVPSNIVDSQIDVITLSPDGDVAPPQTPQTSSPATKNIPVSPPKRQPSSTTIFTIDRISKNWKNLSDAYLSSFAETIFYESPAIINTNEFPIQQQHSTFAEPVQTPVYESVEPVEVVNQVEFIDETAQTAQTAQTAATGLTAIILNLYSAEDGIGLIRDNLGAYDAVQFAEVTSNCVVDFSYGIFDKYQLNVNEAEYSSYIIINEKYLMPNPSRFGASANPVIDEYFLGKTHPEIAFDFFYGNNPATTNTVANSELDKVQPAIVEKRNNVFVLVEKGKIFIRK